MRIFTTLLFLVNFVLHGQNIVIAPIPTFNTILLSIDTLTKEEIQNLKLKSEFQYVDSILDIETHYDRNGNKVYRKGYNGHLFYLDSFFYSKNIEIKRSYDKSNKLLNWHKKTKSGNKITEEYYDKAWDSENLKQAFKRELKYKNKKVIYRKCIEYEKLKSIEFIKYNKKGHFLGSNEVHYDYKKDSLVNITKIFSKNGHPTQMTHTNLKHKHYILDTSVSLKKFKYNDYYEDYIQFFDNKAEIGYIVFDIYGNIKATENYFRITENSIKKLHREYDIENKTYKEIEDLIEYYNNGLFKKSNHLKTICRYEYFK